MKRNVPTVAQAEQAAELLGLDPWELGNILRDAAAHEVEEAAKRVRMFEPLEVGEARRYLRASQALKDAALHVEQAKTA